MYIPKRYLQTDDKEIINFIKRFSFGTIITSKNDYPIATHLPFVISERADKLFLVSHFAKANEQWQALQGNKVLVIFTEPHAYISPKNYEKKTNVPTWNYISVHTYGQARLITDTLALEQLLEQTISNFEVEYKQQWDGLPQEYKTRMMRGIVGFEIEITEVQAKEKLSQNKTRNERQNVVQLLSKSEDSNEAGIADYMRKRLDTDLT